MITELPPRDVHVIFNWASEADRDKIITSFPIETILPVDMKCNDKRLGKPEVRYEFLQNRIKIDLPNDVDGFHTIYNDTESVRETWLDIYDCSFKSIPRPPEPEEILKKDDESD